MIEMDILSNRNKIKDKKKYLLFSQLYSLLSSGLNFSHSFELLIEGEEKNERDMLKKVYHEILVGNEFWKSLKIVGGFSELDCGVIRVGEETGKINQALMFLSNYYRRKNEQKRMLVNALSYPLIIILTACMVLFFMISIVVPMFEQVYLRMGSDLPEITKLILELSSRFPLFMAGSSIMVLLLIGVKLLYGKTPQYQSFISGVLLRMPLVGSYLRKHYEALFCGLLHLLVSSEVPLIKSLLMLEKSIVFYPYRKSFADMVVGLKEGMTFSDNIEKYKIIYGNRLVTLIRVGEETNCLSDILARQSADLTIELEYELKQIGNLLEPVLIFGVGIVVAVILIAMYMPMFQLGQTIG